MGRGHKPIDLKDKIFGKLYVVERDLTKRSVYWICKCECGNIKSIRSDCLRKRGYTDCGCVSAPVKIGDKFGRLTVIATSEKRYRNEKYWKCRCDCENVIETMTYQLTSGGTKSCGCLMRQFDRYKNPHQIGEIRPYYWSHIVKQAECRNIEVTITPEYIWGLWQKQDGKCAISGLELTLPNKSREKSNTTASLDRIDSLKGYIDGNVWWIHKHINFMKNKFDFKYFIEICNTISEYQKMEILNETKSQKTIPLC